MRAAALALLALLAPLGLRAEPKLTGGPVSIPRNLVASGGGISSGGGLILDSDVGEGAIAAASGPGYATAPGLMPLIAQPGSVTSIVAVSKSTGTLTLSWTSPGLDGAVADVTSGFYRIDASSDPLHAFDPTVFTVEFATASLAGSTQTYTLTGLLPNTTYYSRVYLADARKSVAETSAASVESSLSRVPAAPAFTGVFATSVTISWTLPAGGAEGFRLDASSVAFGAGIVSSSSTPAGTVVTLTVSGLQPRTTYFFNLGSLNWQSEVDFTSVLTTRTTPGGPMAIQNLSIAADALNRRVTLTWTNPVFNNPAGVTVLVSSNPISSALADGTPYPFGSAFADGSIVKSTGPASSYVETTLTLDVTGYFSLYSRDTANSYSVAVSTFLALDLPPMAPAGLSGALSPSATSFILNWAGVGSSLDGTLFAHPAAPSSWELDHYDVYRATGIVRSNWIYVGSATASALSYAADVPVPGTVYYYRVVSRDAFAAGLGDSAMAVDTLGDLFAVHPDQVSRLEIPASMAGVVRPAGNPTGQPLLIRAHDRASDLGGRVVKSVSFDPVSAPSDRAAVLPNGAADYDVALNYQTMGGIIVPSSVLPVARPANPSVAANAAADQLSAYYVDGPNAAKIFGKVDTTSQEVAVQSALLGNYQIRTVLRDQGFNFDVSGVSNRAITPNGDGLNDTVVFSFDNPKDSAVTGKIYDIKGRYVSDMTPGPVAGTSLMWDAKARGGVVPRGVYIYQIRAEDRTFSGTVVVIR